MPKKTVVKSLSCLKCNTTIENSCYCDKCYDEFTKKNKKLITNRTTTSEKFKFEIDKSKHIVEL